MSEQILVDKQDLVDYAQTLLAYVIGRGYFPTQAPNQFEIDCLDTESAKHTIEWAARLDKVAKLINEYRLPGSPVQIHCDFEVRARHVLAQYELNNDHPIKPF